MIKSSAFTLNKSHRLLMIVCGRIWDWWSTNRPCERAVPLPYKTLAKQSAVPSTAPLITIRAPSITIRAPLITIRGIAEVVKSQWKQTSLMGFNFCHHSSVVLMPVSFSIKWLNSIKSNYLQNNNERRYVVIIVAKFLPLLWFGSTQTSATTCSP